MLGERVVRHDVGVGIFGELRDFRGRMMSGVMMKTDEVGELKLGEDNDCVDCGGAEEKEGAG